MCMCDRDDWSPEDCLLCPDVMECSKAGVGIVEDDIDWHNDDSDIDWYNDDSDNYDDLGCGDDFLSGEEYFNEFQEKLDELLVNQCSEPDEEENIPAFINDDDFMNKRYGLG